MKLYLASSFSDRDVLRSWADDLRRAGHIVTSRWLSGSHDIVEHSGDERRLAEEDFEDVEAADTLVLFVPVNGRRGGCHVEFGLALAWGKRLIIVPSRSNVFHWLPTVECYPDWPLVMNNLGPAAK